MKLIYVALLVLPAALLCFGNGKFTLKLISFLMRVVTYLQSSYVAVSTYLKIYEWNLLWNYW